MRILVCVLALALVGQDPSRLAVIREAAPFALVDQNEKPVKLEQFKGKVLLVSFVFTTCNGTCPATTHRMASVQEQLKRNKLWNPEKMQFLSITLDPERDTAEVLRRYMKLYDIEGPGWSFVTGPKDAVAKTIASWDMWVKPVANGQLDHPSRIFLLDRKLRVREIYNIELFTVPNVCDDIALLLHEGN